MLALIKPLLDKSTLDFWESNLSKIKLGVLYSGTWEKLLRGMNMMAFTRKDIITKLMRVEDLNRQSEIWNRDWKTKGWRVFMKLLCNNFLWSPVVREPGAKLIPRNFAIDKHLLARLDHLSKSFLLRKNHFANLIFLGHYGEACVLPPHLQKKNFDVIKANLHRIEIVNNSLERFLALHVNEIDAFSLSDFASYAQESVFRSIWEKIVQAAKPNAKFCERQFLVKRETHAYFNNVKRNAPFEQHLENSDGSFIYSFCAGHIEK